MANQTPNATDEIAGQIAEVQGVSRNAVEAIGCGLTADPLEPNGWRKALHDCRPHRERHG
ncbi:hypothetical protein [Fodinicurvata sp. EGI_FJ10296]|uniref:hypothetical protein n=1 Tax=Fodinicurvata sp. EGI_FJ10296 TaxID=3231908 RepID=UPI003456BAE1